MGRRALKRHVQQELPKTRKRDKNGQFRGGKRKGAGRPRVKTPHGRPWEPRVARSEFSQAHPVHVVLRVVRDVGSLRTHEGNIAVREARMATLRLEQEFRIIHFSLQGNHIHLIVEAKGKESLTRGMRVFTISCARQLNAILSASRGVRRRGPVFVDRYYARVLKTPREVRNCLAYVLNNWRHHHADRARMRDPWKVDPFSSALAFDGWKELGEGKRYAIPPGYDGGEVWAPSVWLLRVGWRRCGLISVYEVPGGGDE